MSMVFIVSCSNDSTEGAGQSNDNRTDSDNAENEADEVEITLPVSFLGEETDIDQVQADAVELGMTNINRNDDGSITYSMPKDLHQEWMSEYAAEIDTAMTNLEENEHFVSIATVAANDNYSTFTITVYQEAFEENMEGMAAYGLGFSGMYYQFMNGEGEVNTSVTIEFVNQASGAVFDQFVFPDDLE